jgi:two-component system, cell cycle response regulator
MLPVTRRRRGDESHEDVPVIRALIAEDDPNFRTWLCVLLRTHGLHVTGAVDGAEALELLSASHFDLLLCDLEMPRMSGLDLIREVRADPALSHIYAITLTSHEDLDSKIAALTAGFDDFLNKGCTEIEVVARIIAAKRMLTRNAALSAAAIEWQTVASRDELTGVATRRRLIHDAELALAERRPVGLVLLDLDDFKLVNDRFGHLTGDRILHDIGGLFLRRTRASDLIARYGGDEFVLLTRDLPVDDLPNAAERLKQEIESLSWSSGDSMFGITVTTGIAHSDLVDSPTLERLLDIADRDLYAHKWMRKHPLEPQQQSLYEYPGRHAPGSVVRLPATEASASAERTRREEEN